MQSFFVVVAYRSSLPFAPSDLHSVRQAGRQVISTLLIAILLTGRHAWARALRSADRGIVLCFLSRYQGGKESSFLFLNPGALYRSEKWAGFRRNIGLFISAALRLCDRCMLGFSREGGERKQTAESVTKTS